MLRFLTYCFSKLHQWHCRALGHYILVISSDIPHGTRTRAFCLSCACMLYDHTVYEKSDESRSNEMLAALKVISKQSKQVRALYLDELEGEDTVVSESSTEVDCD